MNKTEINISSLLVNQSTSIDIRRLDSVLEYFNGFDKPSSDFFKAHLWILYLHIGICVHGFIMNTFLVSSRQEYSTNYNGFNFIK